MSKKKISRKCIDCKNCSAPSIIERCRYDNERIRKIVYRCESGVSHYETKQHKVKDLLIDDRTEINCIKFSRK